MAEQCITHTRDMASPGLAHHVIGSSISHKGDARLASASRRRRPPHLARRRGLPQPAQPHLPPSFMGFIFGTFRRSFFSVARRRGPGRVVVVEAVSPATRDGEARRGFKPLPFQPTGLRMASCGDP